MVRKILLVVALIFITWSFVGCQTFQGLGQDISTTGEALTDVSGGP